MSSHERLKNLIRPLFLCLALGFFLQCSAYSNISAASTIHEETPNVDAIERNLESRGNIEDTTSITSDSDLEYQNYLKSIIKTPSWRSEYETQLTGELSAVNEQERRELASAVVYKKIRDLYAISPNQIQLMYDPPTQTRTVASGPDTAYINSASPLWNYNIKFFHTALGLYVHTTDDNAKVCYKFGVSDGSVDYDWNEVTVDCPLFATNENPYIPIWTPFQAERRRYISLVGIAPSDLTWVRTPVYNLIYDVEAGARPNSYMFFVPGLETSGQFLRIGLEMAATARAQASSGQEFADFNSPLGVGTYINQVTNLTLTMMDPLLKGFEGGVPVNVTYVDATGNTQLGPFGKQYGILVPYHNGQVFHGKVVRIDLQAMGNISTCMKSWRYEYLNAQGNVVVMPGSAPASSACIFWMDLATIHPQARGFRRAFVGYPYVFLSPGEYNVLVRLDMSSPSSFGIASTVAVDLDPVDSTLGGYQGGFFDNGWACYNPFRTYYGPVGGIRSNLPVDKGHTRPFYSSVILCVNPLIWTRTTRTTFNGVLTKAVKPFATDLLTLDLSKVQPVLRGFSDAIIYGRYAYFSPFAYVTHDYIPYFVRMYLGTVNIYQTYTDLLARGGKLRDLVDIMDLSQTNPNLHGFSGLFTAGEYVFLVPFRGNHEPYNGQRGHGNVARVDLNQFSIESTVNMTCPIIVRSQIPSTPDDDLIGFSYGFSSGQYAIFVPFFNGIFSGKVARMAITTIPYDPTAQAFEPDLPSQLRPLGDLQELDLTVDRYYPRIWKGFRGGFTNIWYGSLS